MNTAFIFAVDLAAIAVIVLGIYVPRHRRRDMVLAYVALNVGVMLVAFVLSTSAAGAGLGLGLFGVLSIIRLRSSALTQEEVAYFFVALSLGLVAGLRPTPLWLLPALAAALVATVWAIDHPRLLARHRRQVITLDAAYTDETALTARLESMLDADVRRLVVEEVDLVRDVTVVDVRFQHRARPATPAPTTPVPLPPPPCASEHADAADPMAVTP
ncbi:MAG: DUF4956 domain-containing protein [Desertimonas sp.]